MGKEEEVEGGGGEDAGGGKEWPGSSRPRRGGAGYRVNPGGGTRPTNVGADWARLNIYLIKLISK